MTEMTPAEAVFFAAAALPVADRAGYLDRACAGNDDLRRQVERMLAARSEVGDFLEPSPALPDTDGETNTFAAGDGTGSFDDTGATADRPGKDEHVGAILGGKYKLIEAIGEGGMGSVYLAQQTEPVKRAVAVKVIKAGMDCKAVLARFEAERQALALMDHPNIARVLDAGTTERGRPYVVMELVKGVPITQFCDERKLTLRQRLELFVSVCHAIQHAHQKGVIHRDIKPSNVLVALYDDSPIPKVIDFGVAKAAGPALTDKTLITGFGAVVGTPEYMSPEQASLNNLDIDTRSDVYSLGVLLYELLTGTTPVDRKSLGRAALLEVLRIVREVEAPRPSTVLSTSDALPSISANRGTEPTKLSKLLKGELDWVLLKALDKDRTRRYESANGFAQDIQRYLADEVVGARPPDTGYRLKKFVKRHKAPVISIVLVLLALIAGTATTTWGFLEARRQRDAADEARRTEEVERKAAVAERNAKEKALADEREARRAEWAERERAHLLLQFFTKHVIEAARPKVKGGLGPNVTILESLDAAERGIEVDFANQPEVECALRLTLGKTFATLGLYDRAEAQYRRADEASEALQDRLVRRVAELALLMLREQRLTEVRIAGTRDRAAGLLDTSKLVKEVADGRSKPNFTHARNLLRLAQVRLAMGEHREAEADFRECLDVFRKIDRDNEWAGLAKALLGECLTKQKRYAEAEVVLLECHADMTRRAGYWFSEFKSVVPEVLDRLITLYTAMKKPDEVKKYRDLRAMYPPELAPPPREK